MLHKIRGWLKRDRAETDYENVTCKNCETHFSGHFCPECGQAVREYDKPLSFLFYNFLGDFFAFDTRFFRTYKALLLKPGFLTQQFFDGKRVPYAPPFRIFIFASFVLFLLLQIYTNRGLTTVLDSGFDEGKIGLDSVSMAIADSVLHEINAVYDSARTEVPDGLPGALSSNPEPVPDSNYVYAITLETFRNTENLREALGAFALELEQKLKEEENPKKRAKLREQIRLCRSPEQASAKMLEYMSWAFFLLLPIFALILKLFYARRKVNYMRHLVFAIHLHSFAFILFILIVGLYLALSVNLDLVTRLILLVFPVYFVLALKKFYGQHIGKVILKFIGISFIYNVVFWVAVGFVFLNAISVI